jgi:hypothetical protein
VTQLHMTQLELVPAAPALTRGQRLDMLRRRHRAWLAREAQVERVVRIVAPHLRDESRAEVPTLDVLDDITPVTVRLRGVA